MAVVITGRYSGDLKVRVRHELSGTECDTAAPLDNQGDGSAFSPTDLVATALGSCVVTVMAIAARRDGIPFDGASFRVEKHMAADPRRIDALPMVITMPAGLTVEQRERLEKVGSHCPVHRSIHPDIATPLTFEYPD
ncbi:MAG: OsmC family protein [Longimicrobiales bacterium]|nr:OsmC family protein [Longimicrobiales bacterium]